MKPRGGMARGLGTNNPTRQEICVLKENRVAGNAQIKFILIAFQPFWKKGTLYIKEINLKK